MFLRRTGASPRADILTYVWLWPDAKPVSAAQLTASVRVPASMGADGIILWGAHDRMIFKQRGFLVFSIRLEPFFGFFGFFFSHKLLD